MTDSTGNSAILKTLLSDEIRYGESNYLLQTDSDPALRPAEGALRLHPSRPGRRRP